MKLFFVGIGGIGMSALARIFKNLGFKIYGSDVKETPITAQLENEDIEVFIGQTKENILKVKPHLVIRTNAVSEDHVEVQTSRDLKIPVLTYPQGVGIISNLLPSIGITGTHGKTSTTAMISKIFKDADTDPFVLIGALYSEFGNKNFRIPTRSTEEIQNKVRKVLRKVLKSADNITSTVFTRELFEKHNIKKIKSPFYFIFEADEYKDAFLNHTFDYLVIVDVDYDHADYFKSKKQYLTSFARSILNTKKAVILNERSENIQEILNIAKSLDKGSQLPEIVDYSSFIEKTKQLKLYLKTDFIIIDASAAYALAKEVSIPEDIIIKSLQRYKGVWRRFEIIREKSKNTPYIINDYAHNPKKIYMALLALFDFVKQHQLKKVTIIFEPHQYNRLYTLQDEFVGVIAKMLKRHHQVIEAFIITDIYAARSTKEDREKIDAKRFVRKVNRVLKQKKIPFRAIYGNTPKEQVEKIQKNLYQCDAILCLSAGELGILVEKTLKG